MSLLSISAFEKLINQSLGKADTETVQQGVSIGGMIAQGVLEALVARLSSHINVTDVDAAMAKIFDGAVSLEQALSQSSGTTTSNTVSQPVV
ncbi:hypothetical protein AA106555_1504 [Neokomagataea thailandica NBRC 106555]|uniref:Uncharacterized protein n=2 Tax=Neokomagataea TaxID=1223423 RepID=A0A4Y6V7W8_9PROT|nr:MULTISPECIES: hypothetical protein [Neokomagataea]QDH24646.1 hypothetical protein D5366_04735 [Neokomagataea tanensis]GBR53959.1 hypothetical protein AA106555_1504 [Neokomagataea thailandica NBRC 106555]